MSRNGDPQLAEAGDHDLLERARCEVRATVDEARQAIWNLRHGPGDGSDLVPAVTRLAERLGLESGVKIEVESTGGPLALGAETEESLVLLIREALQNAIRHAAPKKAAVRLTFERRRLRVAIEDDGCGFDPAAGSAQDGRHYGLTGMRERVEKLGGDYELTSAPGSGTHVRLSIPVTR